MNTLYVKLCGLTGAIAAMPLLDCDLWDYVRTTEFRALLAESVLTPLLTSLSSVAVQAIVERMFGVI